MKTKIFLIVLGLLILLGIGKCIYHNHKYKCVKYHRYWQRSEFSGKTTHSAHWVYICDSEVLRVEYEKNPLKYPNALHCK